MINTRNGFVVQLYKHMDLADIAREVGALKDWEEVRFTDEAAA